MSKKGQHETLTELTDKFYKGENPESTSYTSIQNDPQAIYVSILILLLLTRDVTKGLLPRRRCRGDSCLVMS